MPFFHSPFRPSFFISVIVVMWGDTVALIKLAPRPIKLVVAPEVSPLPHSVRKEMAKESGPRGVSLTPTAGANDANRFDFRDEC